jgi:hypothetical protein
MGVTIRRTTSGKDGTTISWLKSISGGSALPDVEPDQVPSRCARPGVVLVDLAVDPERRSSHGTPGCAAPAVALRAMIKADRSNRSYQAERADRASKPFVIF